MRTPALLLLLLAFVSIIPPSSCHGEWDILTEQNFSSQIRLHPHILLFVTAPWCGESRSLKNEITQLVHTSDEYGSLKLMVVYRNSEKVLAQAIGATNEITILYYHHSVPYNYRGKLRALNILSSLRPYLASPPEELPLKHLKSPESLKDFLESSDKALILFEFCGWTSTLLSELKRNVTEDNLWHGNFSKKVETDRVLKLRGKNNQKENDRANGGSGQTCNHEQFKQFSSFLSKLIAAAKEFSLPPERQKFGLITEKSLASPFIVGASDSWAAVLQLAGCPHCSNILKAGDDIQRLLKMENPIVSELEDNRQDHESSLPANKPSVILFVDRSSGSLETRRKSMKALCTFREVAAQHKASDIINWGNDIKSQNSVSQADEESGSVSLQKTARSFKTIKLENRVSFVIMDGDKNVALDTIASGMEGSSLQELLTNLVHRRKEKKLCSIAKDVGFRLLSDDVHIKILDALPSQAEVIPGQDTSSAEGSSESSLEPREGDVQNKVGMSSKEKDKMKPPESESSSQDDKEQVSTNRSKQLVMDKAGVYKTKNVEEEIKVLLNSESKEDLVHSFTGLFFFSDANYKLLRGLTGDVKIPSAVIIDPALQQHYVLQDEVAFSYSSLVDSLHGYLNGSLSPYTRSETTIHKPKEATVPPFVNLDFHEADSIPRITVNRFSHMVQAWNQSSGEKAPCPLCEDVLVLFGNSWCGFCQRMELAVREVYRSLKDCKAILQRESKFKHNHKRQKKWIKKLLSGNYVAVSGNSKLVLYVPRRKVRRGSKGNCFEVSYLWSDQWLQLNVLVKWSGQWLLVVDKFRMYKKCGYENICLKSDRWIQWYGLEMPNGKLIAVTRRKRAKIKFKIGVCGGRVSLLITVWTKLRIKWRERMSKHKTKNRGRVMDMYSSLKMKFMSKVSKESRTVNSLCSVAWCKSWNWIMGFASGRRMSPHIDEVARKTWMLKVSQQKKKRKNYCSPYDSSEHVNKSALWAVKSLLAKYIFELGRVWEPGIAAGIQAGSDTRKKQLRISTDVAKNGNNRFSEYRTPYGGVWKKEFEALYGISCILPCKYMINNDNEASTPLVELRQGQQHVYTQRWRDGVLDGNLSVFVSKLLKVANNFKEDRVIKLIGRQVVILKSEHFVHALLQLTCEEYHSPRPPELLGLSDHVFKSEMVGISGNWEEYQTGNKPPRSQQFSKLFTISAKITKIASCFWFTTDLKLFLTREASLGCTEVPISK